jgi:phage terminase large subunit GpA-like protein
VAEDPGPMLWIMPSESLARSFSETRLQPSLKDCQPCAEQIPENSDLFKLCEMHFKDSTLNLVGSNSVAQLSSRPVRYLFADEIDKFPERSNKEAGALDLARVRTATFWNSKTVLTSTPTLESSQIWQAYLLGSQHKYHVKCPNCGHAQELIFSRIKWPDDHRTRADEGGWNLGAVEKLAYLQCQACPAKIPQLAKQGLIRSGFWQQTNLNCPDDKVSFHISALYSPWRSWGSIAREFLEVKDSYSGLQNFTNAVLAEPWKLEQGERIEVDRLHELKSEYSLGTCPAKPVYLTVSADVQRDCVYFTVRAWGLSEESWLIDYGKLPDLSSLTEVMNREYEIKGSDQTIHPYKGLVDSGYDTQSVYEFCASSMRRFLPCKGWEKLSQPVKQANIKFIGGRGNFQRTLALVHFNDNLFKSDLYIRRIQDGQGPQWHIPSNVGTDFLKQLTAEKLVEKTNSRGVPEQVWHRTHRDNHYGDCEKQQLVQGYLLSASLKKRGGSSAKVDEATAQKLSRSRRAGMSSWVNSWKTT